MCLTRLYIYPCMECKKNARFSLEAHREAKISTLPAPLIPLASSATSAVLKYGKKPLTCWAGLLRATFCSGPSAWGVHALLVKASSSLANCSGVHLPPEALWQSLEIPPKVRLARPISFRRCRHCDSRSSSNFLRWDMTSRNSWMPIIVLSSFLQEWQGLTKLRNGLS